MLGVINSHKNVFKFSFFHSTLYSELCKICALNSLHIKCKHNYRYQLQLELCYTFLQHHLNTLKLRQEFYQF